MVRNCVLLYLQWVMQSKSSFMRRSGVAGWGWGDRAGVKRQGQQLFQGNVSVSFGTIISGS